MISTVSNWFVSVNVGIYDQINYGSCRLVGVGGDGNGSS